MGENNYPPAGWYPDPQTPGLQRYWDGFQWGQSAPAVPAANYPPPPPPSTSSRKWVVVIGACIALVLLIGVIGAVAGGGDDEAGVTAGAPTTTRGEESSEAVPAETDPASTTTTAAPTTAAAVTGFTKYEALGETWVSVGIVLTGLSGGSQELTVSLLDAAGTPLSTTTEYVGSDRDGGEVLASATFTDDTPTVASVRVDVSDASSFVDSTPFPLTVAGHGFDGNFWSVKGTATNDRSENIELGEITCVAFKAGQPVGGVRTYTDTIVPGAQVAWEAQDTFDPQADEVRCQAES